MELEPKLKLDLIAIASRLKNLMKQKGINQNQLAQKINITPQTLSSIFNAKTLISTETLLKCALIFNVTTDFILTGNQPVNNNTLYQHLKIAKDIENKIKDVEYGYQNSEISGLIKDVPENKKTSIFDLFKIIIILSRENDETNILPLLDKLDDETHNTLIQLQKEYLNSLSKRQRTEESK